jgi:hypothetical protein
MAALCLLTYGAARLAPAAAVIRSDDSSAQRIGRVTLFLAIPILLAFFVAIVLAAIAA